MSEKRLIAVAAEDAYGLDGQVSVLFGRCPFYVLVQVSGDTVDGSQVIANPHFGSHQQGMMLQFIHNLGTDVIIAGGMESWAIDMFHRFGIDVATGIIGTVEEVLGAYLRGKHRGVVAYAHGNPDICGGDSRQRGASHG